MDGDVVGGEGGVTEVVEGDIEGGGVKGGAVVDRRKPRNASWNATGSMSCRRRKSARSNCRSRRWIHLTLAARGDRCKCAWRMMGVCWNASAAEPSMPSPSLADVEDAEDEVEGEEEEEEEKEGEEKEEEEEEDLSDVLATTRVGTTHCTWSTKKTSRGTTSK